MLFGYIGFKWYFLKVVLNSGAREMAQTVKTVVVKVAQLSSVSLASWLAVKKFSYTIYVSYWVLILSSSKNG